MLSLADLASILSRNLGNKYVDIYIGKGEVKNTSPFFCVYCLALFFMPLWFLMSLQSLVRYVDLMFLY